MDFRVVKFFRVAYFRVANFPKVGNSIKFEKLATLFKFEKTPMPIAPKYFADFNEGKIFHVYNRTNNRDLLFYTDENRRFFLNRYQEYLSVYLDSFCWCLLSNHFHLLVRVKAETTIKDALIKKEEAVFSTIEKKFLQNEASLSILIEQAFKRLFQSYAMSFNKVFERNGSLFCKPFRRIEVNKDAHFTQSVIYIHGNPVKHGLVKNLAEHRWSSWHSYMSDAPSKILRGEVLEWFSGKERFIKTHYEQVKFYYDNDIASED